MKYPLYVSVNGIQYWHCEHCSEENLKGCRCKICGRTVRERRKKK